MGSKIKRRGPSLKGFANRLRALPRKLAQRVAALAANTITTAAQKSFDAGVTCFDEARPLGINGNKLTLVKSGRARSVMLRFVSDGGTKIRTMVPEKYMKILVGVYKTLPIGAGGRIPQKWRAGIDQDGRRAVRELVDEAKAA